MVFDVVFLTPISVGRVALIPFSERVLTPLTTGVAPFDNKFDTPPALFIADAPIKLYPGFNFTVFYSACNGNYTFYCILFKTYGNLLAFIASISGCTL
jgi:hypothetical protein